MYCIRELIIIEIGGRPKNQSCQIFFFTLKIVNNPKQNEDSLNLVIQNVF